MSKLLPCPFCGGPVDVEKTHLGPMGRQFWGVKCRNTLNVGGTCAIEQIPSGSRETAIARWNSRAIPANRVEHNSKGVTEKTEAPAVAVPELTPDDCLELDEILQEGPPYDDVIPKLAAWICEHSRAIPAEHVLDVDEVAVSTSDADQPEALRKFALTCRDEFDHDEGAHRRHDLTCRCCDAEKILRANQGGAEHA